MNFEQLVDLFRANSNCRYGEFNSRIVNSGVETIGCTVPFVRDVAKKCNLTADEALALPTRTYYEIDLLKGMIVSSTKMPFERKREYLTKFADTIENWAVCDVNTVKVPPEERRMYLEFFRQMCASEKTFVCRYGIVNLIANFIDAEYVGKVFDSLLLVQSWGQYYVDMAVAWLVATAMAKCRNETVEFLRGDARTILNVFSYNKALQKIRDSLRISKEDKQLTKTLKRR